MAGICTGPGLTTTDDGLLALDGYRSLAWAGAGGIAACNGLMVDPATNHAWAPPPLQVTSAQDVEDERNVTPGGVGETTLDTMAAQLVVPSCQRASILGGSVGGYTGFRLGSGNFWTVKRYITVRVNGVAVAFTGSQIIAAAENNSGGVLSSGSPADGEQVIVPNVAAGATVRIEAEYTLDVDGYSASASNGLLWRPPRLFLMAWSHL